ncbi:MAG: hypothetical protein AAGD35_19620 [Actinomycetota bacterium]
MTKGITSDPAAPTTPEPPDDKRRPIERTERIPADEPPPPRGALQPDHPRFQGERRGDAATEKLGANVTDQQRASYEAEDRVAEALVARGYIVRQMPENNNVARQVRADYGLPDPPNSGRNPDLYVGTPESGGYIDVLCAEATSGIPAERRAGQILDKAVRKVSDGQAQRVYIDLNRPGQNLTTDDLQTEWTQRYAERADNGAIYHPRQNDGSRHLLLELAVYDGNRLTYLYSRYDQEPG